MSSSTPVLAVCGLGIEARIAAGPGIRTINGGGNHIALAQAIEREIATGAKALVSFGIAGGLHRALRPGDLTLPSVIVDGAETYPVDVAWRAALRLRLPHAKDVRLVGSDVPAVDVAGKVRLHIDNGATVVDMESHVVARIARAHGLPFVALRAIADPWDRDLPHAALVSMRPDGGIAMGRVLRSVARSPGQVPQLIRLARETRSALRALGDGRRLLGDGLGYPDLDQLRLHVV